MKGVCCICWKTIQRPRRRLLKFRYTLEVSCAYYATLRATQADREQLQIAFELLQSRYVREGAVSPAKQTHEFFSRHILYVQEVQRVTRGRRRKEVEGQPLDMQATTCCGGARA